MFPCSPGKIPCSGAQGICAQTPENAEAFAPPICLDARKRGEFPVKHPASGKSQKTTPGNNANRDCTRKPARADRFGEPLFAGLPRNSRGYGENCKQNLSEKQRRRSVAEGARPGSDVLLLKILTIIDFLSPFWMCLPTRCRASAPEFGMSARFDPVTVA